MYDFFLHIYKQICDLDIPLYSLKCDMRISFQIQISLISHFKGNILLQIGIWIWIWILHFVFLKAKWISGSITYVDSWTWILSNNSMGMSRKGEDAYSTSALSPWFQFLVELPMYVWFFVHVILWLSHVSGFTCICLFAIIWLYFKWFPLESCERSFDFSLVIDHVIIPLNSLLKSIM